MAVPLSLDAQLSLRAIFGAHFLFTAMVLMGNWPGASYLFYNTALLGLLIYAEFTPPVDSELPLLKCFFTEGVSILLDIIIMATRYHGYWMSGVDTFALIFAIIQLLGRLPSCLVLFRLYEERRSIHYGTAAGGGASTLGGGNAGGFGGIFGVAQTNPAGYEEFPPSYGAGGPAAGTYATHDTRPLPP